MNAKTSFRQNLIMILSVCCSFIPQISGAQKGWDEDQCIQYAIEHNYRIQNKLLDIKIANADVMTTFGDFLPSVSTVGTLNRRHGRSVDPRTNQYTTESFLESTAGLSISLPIFEGFSRINRLQFHKLNKRISMLSCKVEENSLAFQVLEAFYRYYFDNEMHKLAIEQRRLGECYSERMTEYVNLGMRSRSDLQEVKARLQSDIYQETVKSNDSHLSMLTLKELMSMGDADTLLIAVDGDSIEVHSCSLSIDELYSVSEASLPEFYIMEMKEKSSRESLSIAKGGFSPSVSMEFNLNTGYYDTERNKFDKTVPFQEQMKNNMNRYIGVRISFPLFAGLSHIGTVRKEKLRLQQVQNENKQQRLSLYREIHDTYLSFLTAIQEYRLAEEQLHSSFITWKECEEKWGEGMVSMFELLEKRNMYIQAKAEIVRTKLQYNLKKRMIRFYQRGSFL